jgi:hypothetical protein
MRGLLLSLVAVLDVLGAPLTFLAAHWLRLLRRIGV